MMDEDIDIAGDAEERESPLREAAWDLIEKAEQFMDGPDDHFFRPVFRDQLERSIARLAAILKENP